MKSPESLNKLYYYDVESADGSGIFSATKKFEITEVTVLAVNDKYLVVNDAKFTTIQKDCPNDRYRVYAVLNDPSICIHNNDSCWGNRIHYSLYSETTVKPDAIKKKIEREILKRFGYFIGKIDLSFITKGAK